MPSRRLAGLGLLAALVVSSLFLLAAGLRRLNFDEALALRAGRLELTSAIAEPALVMPATLLFGATSLVVEDPGRLFLALRILVAGSVLLVFLQAAIAAGLSPSRGAFAFILLIAQAGFATHGLEFRYDWGILLGLQIALAGVALGSRRGFAVAGAALVFVGCHQAKGLFLAALLVPVLGFAMRRIAGAARRAVASALATLALWLALLAVLGLGGRWLATYGTFLSLGGDTVRVSVISALGPSMLRDLTWWTVVALALASALAFGAERRWQPWERFALLTGLSTLLFALAHPHAWPYMLALPAPFFALFVAGRWPSRAQRQRQLRWALIAGAALALQVWTSTAPFAPLVHALRAPRTPEVEALRYLKANVSSTDQVLDPAGFAYFLPPCTRQWYSDSLFAERAMRAEWMTELADGVPDSCTWVVNTYRLGGLPNEAKRDLAREYAAVAGPFLRRRSASLPALPPSTAELPRYFDNYW